jgi:hypothetical protein
VKNSASHSLVVVKSTQVSKVGWPMSTPIILAHGALGSWDEVIFLSVGALFLIMMGVSWLRSRNVAPELVEPDSKESTETEVSHFPIE